MAWLGELLKYVSAPRPLIAAIFVAASVLLFGPKFFSNWEYQVPTDWRWVVLSVCIISGSLLAFALASSLGAIFASTWRRFRYFTARFISPVTKEEKGLLVFMGKNCPNGLFNIDRIDHSKFPKLELLELCRSLDRKGLVYQPFADSDFINLTAEGRKMALRLTKLLASHTDG